MAKRLGNQGANELIERTFVLGSQMHIFWFYDGLTFDRTETNIKQITNVEIETLNLVLARL